MGIRVILLDTHALFWTVSEPERLSAKAREAISQARVTTGVAITTMTLLELARLAENHRIAISGSVEQFLRSAITRVVIRQMTPEIVTQAVRLPTTFPRDPADRVIAATAIIEGIPLVTADQRIQQSGVVETIW